jgi:hypothetical protein
MTLLIESQKWSHLRGIKDRTSRDLNGASSLASDCSICPKRYRVSGLAGLFSSINRAYYDDRGNGWWKH